MKIISRKDWGARNASRGRNAFSGDPDGVGLHWEGPHMGTPAESKVPSVIRGIQDFHMDGRGWSDIAYNYVVDPYGNVYEGRGLSAASAAFGTDAGNAHWVAVCYLGGQGDAFTAAARQAIVDLVAYLHGKGVGKGLKGHRDFKSTDCPGDTIYGWLKAGMPLGGGSKPTPDPTPDPDPSHGQPTGKGIPSYPLPAGSYFGPKSGPATSVSGYYSHRSDLERWQRQMAQRGWSIGVDGLYGPETAAVAKSFQKEKGLAVDGLIGPATWRAAWAAPIT